MKRLLVGLVLFAGCLVTASSESAIIQGGGGAGGSGTVTSVDASGGVQTTSGSPITTTGVIRGTGLVNAQVGTTYTIDTGDRGKLVTFSNAGAIAVTLPVAGGTFPAGWYADFQNRGVGTATITPTTSTIDGAANLALPTSSGVRVFSDGTNYFTQRGTAGGSAPADATYWVGAVHGSLSAEISLGALGTGLVINTAGTPSIYAGVTCTSQVLRILNASGAGTCVTLTSAYVDTSVWTGTATSGLLKASSQGVLTAATAGTDYAGPSTVNTWGDGIKQTFNPSDTNAGVNVGGNALEPSAPINGDVFYDSALTTFKFYENDAWRGLGVASLTDTLSTVSARGRSDANANSVANCTKIGDATNKVCIGADATLGAFVIPSPAANTKTLILNGFTWSLWDEEGALALETVDPDAATPLLMWSYPNAAYRPKKSVWFGAGSLSTDGTQCAAPAEVTPLASGVKLWSVICTDNDAGRMHASIVMPDNWDGGTITLESTAVQTAASAGVIEYQAAAQCKGDTEALVTTASYGSEVVWTDTLTGSSGVNRATSGAITPSGTCAAGDFLALYIDIGATNTTTAVATLHTLGFKMKYSVVSRSQ